ncbi:MULTISPECIES: hypothetical protein [unclassified Streptomyces]|uniref:hypothetical protein n=1 Tax=unclassified Streptomyces TaxID=2593676 RepID=UPI00343C18FF
MSRVRAVLATSLVALTALTACSSSSDKPDSASGGNKPASSPEPKPITKELSQAHLTQALLGVGETLPGYTVHSPKSTSEGQSCGTADDDSTPKGWARGSDVDYEYNGSTVNMAALYICLFDTAEDAHSAYASWKGHEANKEQKPKRPVGDENTLVINPGSSDDSVHGYVRSGRVNISVLIDGATGGDPSGAQAMLSAALKRLQQLQDGKPATVTAVDEQAGARQ